MEHPLLGLGIDTGGTFTDAALYDLRAGRVRAQAKAPTTHDDYAIGIAATLDNFDALPLESISMVSLSSTLATNACVENKGGRAAMLLLGYDSRLVGRLCSEYGLAIDALTVLEGRHDQRGEEYLEPDWEAVVAWARKAGADNDALGVAEYWGIRNPAYEKRALDILRGQSGKPCAAAHQLTGEINSLKRAATTMLNLRLIPVMEELLRAVRAVLDERGIAAPLWIMRGDGMLMGEQSARETPVELLLSGPAASAQGGAALSDARDCLVVDIGGTTTDIAVLRGGRVALEQEGARVGAWRTGTRAAQVRTIGLGGDTRVTLGKDGALELDVRRVLPLCRLSAIQPRLKQELQDMINRDERRGYAQGEYLLCVKAGEARTRQEADILQALEEGPLSVDALAARLGTRGYFLDTSRLEDAGILLRGALALTDLWHGTGELALFDGEAAALGIRLLAQRLDMEDQDLIGQALHLADKRLYTLLAEHLLGRAMPKAKLGDALDIGFLGAGEEIDIAIRTSLPLIGIGAPTHLLLPRAARRLGTRAILPEHAGVGGAVGAICALVSGEAEAVVRPIYEPWGVDGFMCHAPGEALRFDTQQEARAHAERAAMDAALDRARSMGAQAPSVTTAWRESSGKAAGRASASFLLEAVVVARAAGTAAPSP